MLNNNHFKENTHPMTQNVIIDDFFGKSVLDEGI